MNQCCGSTLFSVCCVSVHSINKLAWLDFFEKLKESFPIKVQAVLVNEGGHSKLFRVVFTYTIFQEFLYISINLCPKFPLS